MRLMKHWPSLKLEAVTGHKQSGMRSCLRAGSSGRSDCVLRPRHWPPTTRIGQKPRLSLRTWRACVRGDIYELKSPRDTRGHEQKGNRFAVVMQSDLLPLSTWLVAPTSTSAREASFRPEIDVNGQPTLVLVEQTAAVDPERLGNQVGHVSHRELTAIDEALKTVLGI